ncbi:MAG TPA: cobyrinate a,c-diamide synthase [Syntrophorhabdales bacterium]|nr:cobyrinate a,c-diamide synthase [Syntrophorhabdales bacterium]
MATPNTNHQTLVQAPPRLMIAAPQGRSGKTTITIALARALRNRGLSVQPFKKGPDYIDPSWLRLAAGTDCFNLDSFFMPEDALLSSFAHRSRGADIALLEGAMGLFDSPEADGKGSAAWLARMLQAPIILVVNAERMTRSVAALVSGFQHFEPGTRLAGVILNHVSGPRHVEKLRDAVERLCAMPVLGAVPRDSALSIAERHLGLVPSGEKEQAESIVEAICDKVATHLNIDAIVATAQQAPEHFISELCRIPAARPTSRIGVVTDRAFSFYYPENLEALQEAGADLVSIDALSDHALPKIDGLYIGGGFPELYAAELEANERLRRDIARRIENGLPTYAECAGLMYLCRAIRWQGRRYEMVGAVPAEVEISKRPQGHGYVELETAVDNPWFPPGFVLRGHEFHHSKLIAADPPLTTAYTLRRGHGIDGRVDGFLYKNLLASYTHLHALGVPQWAPAFVSLVARISSKQSREEGSYGSMSRLQGRT